MVVIFIVFSCYIVERQVYKRYLRWGLKSINTVPTLGYLDAQGIPTKPCSG